MAPPIWTEEFKVHSYEVDFKRAATLETLCRFFQEAAWNHAEALGVGYERLASDKKLWVLSRFLLEVGRHPLWGERIQVQTWPRPVEGPFALRDFEFFDSAHKRLLTGSSAWLVLDSNTRKPQRVDKFLAGIPAVSERRASARSPAKLSGADGSAQITRRTIDVRHSDLDVNNHVNNARYIGWLLDSYSAEFHRDHEVRSCEVNYLGETGAGNVLAIGTHPVSEETFEHSILGSRGSEVCRARLSWAPIQIQPNDG